MKKMFFILAASAVLMLSCNDALNEWKYELEYEYDCGCAPIDISSIQDAPFSWTNDIPALRASTSTHKEMASLDMERIFREDMEDKMHNVPPRFGYPHRVNYNLENSGEWTTLPDGSRLWRLTISASEALSINLLYDKFWIPDGAKFWIYSTDRNHLLCKLTSENNSGTRDDMQGFATGLVFSDQITLEYFLPSYADEKGFISIVYVVHGYRHINATGVTTRSAWIQERYINVNCPVGQDWRNERNAVALILVDGYRHCTGFLVNTTANDGRPLLITAHHCLQRSRVGTSPEFNIDAVRNHSPHLPHWSFKWHYESPTCAGAPSTRHVITTGARLIANNHISDFALLDLSNVSGGNNRDPRKRAGITPYFLGWDRSGNPGTTRWVGIHHPHLPHRPQINVKKISLFNQVWNHPFSIHFRDHGFTTARNAIWVAPFYRGIIVGGSSGSPLINNNRRVIGQAATISPLDGRAYYGRFDVSWYGRDPNITTNVTPPPQRRLNHWLAPGRENNAPPSIGGLCPRPVIQSIQVHSATTGGTSLSVNHTSGATFSWSISPDHGVILGGGGHNTSFLTAHIPFPGHYRVTVTVSNACGTVTMSRDIHVTGDIHHPITTCPHCGTTSNLPPGCLRCPHRYSVLRDDDAEWKKPSI